MREVDAARSSWYRCFESAPEDCTMHALVGRISFGFACLLAALACLVLPGDGIAAETGRRVALVIGNSGYQHTAVLPNPTNDAKAVAGALRDLDFEVIEATDLYQPDMATKLQEFAAQLDGADVGLFYYAGHGIQISGENYLVPVDARLQKEGQVPWQTIRLQAVLNTMEAAVPVRLVILDACRDNPLAKSLKRSAPASRSNEVGEGLAEIQTAVGTLIAYATAPGDVAADGEGANSPFTGALLKHIKTPNLEIRQLLTRVRRDVYAATEQGQLPWDSSSLQEDFYFVREAGKINKNEQSEVNNARPQQKDVVRLFDERQADTIFWDSIRNSSDPSDFADYLRRFPTGIFANLARRKIEPPSNPPAADLKAWGGEEASVAPGLRFDPGSATPSKVETAALTTTIPEPISSARPAVRAADGYSIIAPAVAAPDKRVALVIGNAEYTAATPLMNPKNDAADMASALSELGFEVLKGVNLPRRHMSRITRDFARKARDADIALAYYSGHGIQFERTNYLVPIDGQLQDEYDLREMVELDQVIRDTTQAKKLGMVVVDASRDDPLATRLLAKSLGASSSVGSGLAAPKLPPSQSLIAYATAADFEVYDGDPSDRNSPFTAALLRNIKTPKLDVRQLLGKVSDEVREATGNAQRPDIWAALGSDPIYLVPGPPEPVGLEMADLTIGEVLVVQRSLKALKFWSGAEDGTATPDLTLAVRRWQQSLFTEQTGRLTPQQLIALNRTASRDRPRYALPEFKLNEAVSKAFRGEVEAQRLMGMVYDPAFADAAGFDKDRPTARNFYEMAANQGDVHAASLLGAMLVAPDNPQPDRDAGMRWLEQASKGGDTVAALRMAELVVEREPNPTGYRKAVPFLKIAATDPNTSGMANAWLRHVGQTVVE